MAVPKFSSKHGATSVPQAPDLKSKHRAEVLIKQGPALRLTGMHQHCHDTTLYIVAVVSLPLDHTLACCKHANRQDAAGKWHLPADAAVQSFADSPTHGDKNQIWQQQKSGTVPEGSSGAASICCKPCAGGLHT